MEAISTKRVMNFRHAPPTWFDKRFNVNQLKVTMLNFAQFRRGLHRAGNLIAGN
jgi:hypothetical protein